MATKYNHAFSVCFEVISEHDAENVTTKEIRAALIHMAMTIRDADLEEMAGAPFDSFTEGD